MIKENQQVNFVTKEDLTYLVFKQWENRPKLVHCFTTRHGGVSQGDLATLNLGFNRGDDKDNVIENYKRVCRALEVDSSTLVISKQVHETHIEAVYPEDAGNGIYSTNKWDSVDGIYTRSKGVTLVTHYADCVPLFFYAPNHHIIGMAHAGWRGTVGQIAKKMITIWNEKEIVPLSDIQVAIGPSIGKCCFEVGEEVADAFIKTFPEASFITYHGLTQKYHIDLWACNKQVLMNCGIEEHNIVISGLCTCCHDELFFSHRKTQGKRGTLAGFMALQ